ncbi:MAG: cyclic nucleotide-binding domain-containing protein [Lachnospiraceae bacterium]|nr:cyclic nucleotide-binding domain-containing protein [Lachnospiraceae bacterium]
MTERQFGKGTVIFHEGDVGETFFRVISGKVGIFSAYETDGEYLIKELNPDDYFGEMAVIEAYPRSATAVALSDVKVEEATTSEMGVFFKENPEKVLQITGYIGKCIRDTTEEYIEVAGTIQKLGEGEKKDSLMDKLRKFAGVYSARSKEMNKLSTEGAKRFSKAKSDSVESYSKETIIFKQGEFAECMYEVQGGSVGIYSDYGKSNEKLLSTVEAGEYFGEMGLIDNKPRSATAVIMADNTILETIKKKDLLNLFKENPPQAEAIVAHLSAKLRQVTKKYLESCHLLYDIYNGSVNDSEIAKKASEYVTYHGVV